VRGGGLVGGAAGGVATRLLRGFRSGFGSRRYNQRGWPFGWGRNG